jgi:hypothetical protein
MYRRSTTFILALLLALPIAAPAAMAGPGEGDMLARINSSRAANGLPALANHGSLVTFARNHSVAMAGTDSIWHSTNLGSAASGWSRIGENVGRGPNVPTLHSAFMASSGHRANILGDFTHAGVGTHVTPEGMMYVTVVFMKSKTATTTTTVAPTTTAAPTTTVASQPTQPPATTTTVAPAPKPKPAPVAATTTAAPTTTTTVPVPEPESPQVSAEQVRKHSPEMGIEQFEPCKR